MRTILVILQLHGCKLWHQLSSVNSWRHFFIDQASVCLRKMPLHDCNHHCVGVSKASTIRFVSSTVCFPYPTLNLRRPSFFSRRCIRTWNSLPQHINLLRHFPSSAFAWRHTSSNSVTGNYCCHAREVTLSFMDILTALIYLLTSTLLSASLYVSKRGAYWDRLCRDVVGCHAHALWPNGAS